MTNNLAPAPADGAAVAPDTSTAPDAQGLNADDLAAKAAAEAALSLAPDDSPLDKPKGGAAERIAEVIAERNAIKEYAEYWRNQATANLKPPTPAAPVAPAAKPAPTLDQFANTDGTYNPVAWSGAYAKWSEEQIGTRAAEIVSKQLSAREQTQQQEQAANQWQQRAEAFRAKQPDFDIVVANPALPFNGTLKDLIVGSELGPQVAHYMGQPANVAEAIRISRMDPIRQAAAFGRLEAKVATAPPLKPANITRAPAPPKPVGGGNADVNLETCSMDDYLDARLGRKKR